MVGLMRGVWGNGSVSVESARVYIHTDFRTRWNIEQVYLILVGTFTDDDTLTLTVNTLMVIDRWYVDSFLGVWHFSPNRCWCFKELTLQLCTRVYGNRLEDQPWLVAGPGITSYHGWQTWPRSVVTSLSPGHRAVLLSPRHKYCASRSKDWLLMLNRTNVGGTKYCLCWITCIIMSAKISLFKQSGSVTQICECLFDVLCYLFPSSSKVTSSLLLRAVYL